MTIMSSEKIIGFIGLGVMGQGIAANLLKAGYSLRVYNRSKEKTRALVAHGALAVEHATEVIEPGSIVFTMLSDDEALRRKMKCRFRSIGAIRKDAKEMRATQKWTATVMCNPRCELSVKG
jgi:3-hydroxyisobutyrate dehydrogenase-like beta-hydroxyacid dehydrogenase